MKNLIQDDSHCRVPDWNSVYTGLAFIVNRMTPTHTDQHGIPTGMDLLLSAGENHEAFLHVPDFSAQLAYSPGCLIGILGKVLPHSVPDWGVGERICIAHFLRDNVHRLLDVQRPTFPHFNYFQV